MTVNVTQTYAEVLTSQATAAPENILYIEEQADTIEMTGEVVNQSEGDLYIAEQPDIVLLSDLPVLNGDMAIEEQPDTIIITNARRYYTVVAVISEDQ